MRYKATVVLEVESDVNDDSYVRLISAAAGKIIFTGRLRDSNEEVLLSRMVKIKEKVKEVYEKLKMLHSKKNVNLYYDLLEAILRS